MPPLFMEPQASSSGSHKHGEDSLERCKKRSDGCGPADEVDLTLSPPAMSSDDESATSIHGERQTGPSPNAKTKTISIAEGPDTQQVIPALRRSEAPFNAFLRRSSIDIQPLVPLRPPF
jgi:hypothetical protein